MSSTPQKENGSPDLGSFELEGTVYRFRKPLTGVVKVVDKIKVDITGEMPEILKRSPKEDAPVSVWEAYNEAFNAYTEQVSARLIERWPEYAKAMVENADEKICDPENLMLAEMYGIVQGFRTAAARMTRIRNAAFVSSTISGLN